MVVTGKEGRLASVRVVWPEVHSPSTSLTKPNNMNATAVDPTGKTPASHALLLIAHQKQRQNEQQSNQERHRQLAGEAATRTPL
jgi:hypothetical protein